MKLLSSKIWQRHMWKCKFVNNFTVWTKPEWKRIVECLEFCYLNRVKWWISLLQLILVTSTGTYGVYVFIGRSFCDFRMSFFSVIGKLLSKVSRDRYKEVGFDLASLLIGLHSMPIGLRSTSTVLQSTSTVSVHWTSVNVNCLTVDANCITLYVNCITVNANCITVSVDCVTLHDNCSTVNVNYIRVDVLWFMSPMLHHVYSIGSL